MSDVNELKKVLSDLEKKLISVEKIFAAFPFALWMAIMLFYSNVAGVLQVPWEFNMVYWAAAVIIAVFFMTKCWEKVAQLSRVMNKNVVLSKTKVLMLTGLPWIIGAIIGWGFIPMIHLSANPEVNIALGLISFIVISVFGMFLALAKYTVQKEMIPAFIIPPISIPLVLGATNAMEVACSSIALGYTLTILWYLYSAFKIQM